MKFMETRPELAERIRNNPSSGEAYQLAMRHSEEQPKDWVTMNVSKMDEVLALKFTPGTSLVEVLLQSGDREIVNHNAVR
jgi:predicted NAD-dependent protein-ADP-ribosyltransferase YbiA (DUF1768 family)